MNDDLMAKWTRGTPPEMPFDRETNVALPTHDPAFLMDVFRTSSDLAAAIGKVVQETLREGHDFEPVFAGRCSACGYEAETEEKTCPNCGDSVPLTPPNDAQLLGVESLFDEPNEDRELADILGSIVTYLLVTGTAFVHVRRNDVGLPVYLDDLASEYVRVLTDKRGRIGSDEYFCPRCYEPDQFWKGDRYKDEPCPTCGGRLSMTAYVTLGKGGPMARYYKEEMLRFALDSIGGRVYGFGRVARIARKAAILDWAERYQHHAYSKNETPDSLVFVPIGAAQLRHQLEEAKQQRMTNRSQRRHLFISTGPNAAGKPELVNLMPSLADMALADQQKWIRESIAVAMGVSLTTLGIQTPGKLGAETETLEVSMNTVESIQSIIEGVINDQLLPMFVTDTGEPLITDWRFELKSPKRDDELRKAQVNEVVARTAASLRQAGYEVTLDQKLGLLSLTTSSDAKRQPAAPTGMPGVPGAATRTVLISPPPGNTSAEPTATDGGTTATFSYGTKELGSRNIDAADALSGLVAQEELFLQGARDRYLSRVAELQRDARTMDTVTLERETSALFRDYQRELAGSAQAHIRKIYQLALSEESPEGFDVFQSPDLAAIEALESNPNGFFNAITTFGQEQIDGFREVIRQSLSTPGGNLDSLVRAMGDFGREQVYKLERIARTETTRIANVGRETQWRKYADPSKREFYWVTARDQRVDDLCLDVAAKNPWTLDELAAATTGGAGPFSIHPNDRCVVSRRPEGTP